MVRVAIIIALASITILLVPALCEAFEHELQLGGDLFYAQQQDEAATAHGAGAGLRLSWGFTDALGIVARIAWAGHSVPMGENDPTLRHVLTTGVGVLWALDVFEVVPYFGALTGLSLIVQDEIVAPSVMLDLTGGFDVLLPRDLSVGLSLSYQLAWGVYTIPARFIVGARVSWHWSRERQNRSRIPSPSNVEASRDRYL